MPQQDIYAYLKSRFENSLNPHSLAIMKKVFAHPSVKQRRFACEDREHILTESPDERVARFTRWSVQLSAASAMEAMTNAGVTPDDISVLVLNTCTGYICPGISTYIIEKLKLSPDVRAFDMVGAGCGGAIPNVQSASAALTDVGYGVALSVSTEVCSATFEMGNDLSLIVSNSLFADGAGAAVISLGQGGLTLVDSANLTQPEHRETIRYVHKGGKLNNQLSLRLPEIVGEASATVVPKLLRRNHLQMSDIRHWVVHPGGEKILASVQSSLGLNDNDLRVCREVLQEYGNMSSATVWFILKRIMDAGIKPGERVIMLAFGAGLSAHAALFQA
jgi:predicted naringenin-chalcone synthase